MRPHRTFMLMEACRPDEGRIEILSYLLVNLGIKRVKAVKFGPGIMCQGRRQNMPVGRSKSVPPGVIGQRKCPRQLFGRSVTEAGWAGE